MMLHGAREKPITQMRNHCYYITWTNYASVEAKLSNHCYKPKMFDTFWVLHICFSRSDKVHIKLLTLYIPIFAMPLLFIIIKKSICVSQAATQFSIWSIIMITLLLCERHFRSCRDTHRHTGDNKNDNIWIAVINVYLSSTMHACLWYIIIVIVAFWCVLRSVLKVSIYIRIHILSCN